METISRFEYHAEHTLAKYWEKGDKDALDTLNRIIRERTLLLRGPLCPDCSGEYYRNGHHIICQRRDEKGPCMFCAGQHFHNGHALDCPSRNKPIAFLRYFADELLRAIRNDPS